MVCRAKLPEGRKKVANFYKVIILEIVVYSLRILVTVNL